MITIALRSKYAIMRQSAARCLSTICNSMTLETMRFVIENILPFLGDAVALSNRQGSMELIYRESLLYVIPSIIKLIIAP
jgi:TATA-binding protein-associated factor